MGRKSGMVRKILWSLVGLLVLGLVGMAVFRTVLTNEAFNGTELSSPIPAPDFALTSDHGTVHLADFRGKTVLLYFGYTYCPDICPLTLGKLAQAVQGLGTAEKDTRVIFISVDPARDTPARLGQYVRAFDPSFLGVTGDPQTVAQVAKEYGIFYQKTDIVSPTNYAITHTALVIVIDREGRWRLLWSEDLQPPAMVHDLMLLER